MRSRALELSDELQASPPPLDADDIAEAVAFLTWLEDHHFTFLGYRDYELSGEDEVRLTAVPARGWGSCAETSGAQSLRCRRRCRCVHWRRACST